ncbi:MAG: hypothetical protein JWQ90_347 [Hydrocarboniphaga sp.]|uniref:AbrB/MazE/SpoVT family DNA-binding domain-containing protein n=1 Tax=Hydrocarboniphaga sp. TaxID=2033016 RepID=UPI002633AF36|nr:AbrB/MazE/SpoVT family DNA-binding domain-containing protein [Hydrocarboniphaga sp.]MDB5967897.1 hypothetical protein [Hydrocarboniphaga sp.]
MPAYTIRLSSKGQLVIPRDIREELHWEAGEELTLIKHASGVTIQSKPPRRVRKLVDLIGYLKSDGAPPVMTPRSGAATMFCMR